MMAAREEIVIGIVCNESRDKVLVSRRRSGTHLAGMREFPGGKVGTSESAAQALSRELYEETGIRVDRAHRLAVVNHDYPGRQIRLDAWMVDAWSGEPAGREGQTLEWVPVTGLDTRDFPAANARILKLIELPPLCLITPDLERYEAGFLRQVRDMIDNGLRLIQFRSRTSSRDAHAGAVRELVSMCEGTSCSLLYNGEPEEALMLGAHGVHLRGSALARLKSRPLPADKWVAASCHNREELRHAAAIDADFCLLSPVHRSPSHPGATGMGWPRFESMAEAAAMPVYALGGLKPAELEEARRRGAHGIAMISGVWNDPDPAAVIRRLGNPASE